MCTFLNRNVRCRADCVPLHSQQEVLTLAVCCVLVIRHPIFQVLVTLKVMLVEFQLFSWKWNTTAIIVAIDTIIVTCLRLYP